MRFAALSRYDPIDILRVPRPVPLQPRPIPTASKSLSPPPSNRVNCVNAAGDHRPAEFATFFSVILPAESNQAADLLGMLHSSRDHQIVGEYAQRIAQLADRMLARHRSL